MKNFHSLYFHVPYCLQKCGYCDFYSEAVGRSSLEKYTQQMEQAIKEIAPPLDSSFPPSLSLWRTSRRDDAANFIFEHTLSTLFFGGGTPSLLSGAQLARIMDAVRERVKLAEDVEISLEANPETLLPIAQGKSNLAAYRLSGVNRLSLGAQSFDPDVLQILGRLHTVETTLNAYAMARSAGFMNINLDLIFAVPGQTLQSWEHTLQKAIELNPEHIALYNLTHDHGQVPVLDDEELDLAMYRLAREHLHTAGYEHYEVSNFAKLGFQGRHNLTYWRNEPYLGLGNGAHSSTTTDDPRMTMILGLRLLQEGVNLERFQKRHGKNALDAFRLALEKLQREALIDLQKDRILLSSRGLEIANIVFEELI
jgi:oxygen-independent coproporphyrinogen-3 oxidase